MARENLPCIECQGKLPPRQEDFCSPGCKAKFHNRRASRGAKLYDALMAAIESPSDTTAGFEARAKLMLLDWHKEDVAAGRKRTTRQVYDIRYALPLHVNVE